MATSTGRVSVDSTTTTDAGGRVPDGVHLNEHLRLGSTWVTYPNGKADFDGIRPGTEVLVRGKYLGPTSYGLAAVEFESASSVHLPYENIRAAAITVAPPEPERNGTMILHRTTAGALVLWERVDRDRCPPDGDPTKRWSRNEVNQPLTWHTWPDAYVRGAHPSCIISYPNGGPADQHDGEHGKADG
jgi:hypothetical protein